MKENTKNKILEILFNISPKLVLWFRWTINYRHYQKAISFTDPKTLDEKIQWMKLNYYNTDPLVHQCCDKYAVRQYVEQAGCSEILVELYGAYDNAKDVPWAELPDQFVAKWNFGCGQNLICRDKSQLNIEATIRKFDEWKKEVGSLYKYNAELQYKDIVPKIIVERMIQTPDNTAPVDYKVYCFHGEPFVMLTCTGREKGHPKFYFVDKDWNLMRFNKSGKEAPEGFVPTKPDGYEKVFEYAKILSKPFPFVRADFYLEYGNVYFGELTFTPCGGFDTSRLLESDYLYGSKIDLSVVKK